MYLEHIVTIQIAPPFKHGKSKATLQAALNSDLEIVNFMEPTPWEERYFSQTSVKPGEKFAVVMDPATRMRFATVQQRADGSWKVS